MNPYSVIPFAASVIVASLGMMCYWKNHSSRVHQLFFCVCGSVIAWPFALGVLLNQYEAAAVIWWTKAGHFTCTVAPAVFLDFVVTLLGRHQLRGLVRACYLYALAAIAGMLLTPYYFDAESVYRYSWGPYAKGEWLSVVDAIFGSIVASGSFTLLLKSVRSSRQRGSRLEYNRLRYLALGLGFFSLALVDYLPKYGVPVPPLGSLFLLVFAAIMTYAILMHQLLDFVVAIRRTAIYSILAAIITACYFVGILVMEKWFQGVFGYRSLIATSLVGFATALGFVPIKDRVQWFVDRYFFRASALELAEQNEQLRREVQRAEQLKAVATLAAGMAHEIKNPLTAIKTFAEYLPERYEDPEFRHKFSKVISQEVNKMNDLVHRLLEFAKPPPPKRQSVRISQLLGETLQFLQGSLLKGRIGVETQLSEDDCVLADASQMRQVFLNILLNSIEAMPSGGAIRIASGRHNGHLNIRISDNGPGMSAAVAARAFDPFYTTKPNGTGLGLSVVHSIVREHGGKVLLASREQEGTEVRIHLPMTGGGDGAAAHSDRG